MKKIIFLVGLHGTGKSTIGKLLSEKHGWFHLGLGDLGRLARSYKRPEGISLRLMVCMKLYKPGMVIPQPMIEAIIAETQKHAVNQNVVCDGFPVTPEHLAFLPEKSMLVHVDCSEPSREHRLIERANQTVRKWQTGSPSDRDLFLPVLLEKAKESGISFFNFDNSGDGQKSVSEKIEVLLDAVAERITP